ncbi:MAG: ABC transporter ATP-binding protein [Vagococcus sp.]
MAKTVLDIKNLSKTIGKKTIIKNINFDIKEGEVFGLIGPNGAGKTTVIRSIVGLVSKTSGTILINGIDTSIGFKETIENVGAIIENPEFYMHLSGKTNLKILANMSSKTITDNQLNDIIEKVGLETASHQKVKTYSLGMRQRLGLAQALIHSPSLLILDEPTNGLDPKGMAEFRNIIATLSNEGISVLISSHLLSEIEPITHRFAIIDKGSITHIDTLTSDTTTNNLTYQLEVSNAQTAKQILMKKGVYCKVIGPNVLELIFLKRHMPFIVRELVIHQIGIFSIQVKQSTLEERFFELTKGGNSDANTDTK